MSKKLLSESQVNRWSKLANIKTGKKALNEMGMGHGMAYAREDEEEMAPEGDMGGEDMGDMGADAEMDMGDMGEEPMDMDLGAAEAGADEEMSLDDDKLMSMIKDAVKSALVDAGLTDEMEGGEEEMEMEEEGGEEEMEEEGEEAEGEEAEEGGDELSAEPGEEEEDMEALQEVEVVTNDELINETLKRVLARLRK